MSQSLRIAFQMDPIGSVNPNVDSSFALMEEAQMRGHQLWHYEVQQLSLREGIKQPNGARLERLIAIAQPINVQRGGKIHYEFTGPAERLDLGTAVDVVFMRQDPPFDMAYITATHMLEHIHPHTLVVNDPRSVRDSPEKLLVTHFPDLMPPTLIAWNIETIRAFRSEYRDVVVKPLYGGGGAGVFRIHENDENLEALLELHFTRSREPLIVQRYEPAVRKGDKRVILVDGEPMGAINRVPIQGEARSNMRVGGHAEQAKLTAHDCMICARIGPYLRDHGLILVGIDVIGDYLTEINVTSPTGLQQVKQFDGINLAAAVWDRVEARVAALKLVASDSRISA